MLQNEGLDGKEKQYVTCALDSTSPEEGEGGGRFAGGMYVGWEPICHFSKSIFWANKLLLCLIPGKACGFCCVNLGVLQFVGSLSCVWQ